MVESGKARERSPKLPRNARLGDVYSRHARIHEPLLPKGSHAVFVDAVVISLEPAILALIDPVSGTDAREVGREIRPHSHLLSPAELGKDFLTGNPTPLYRVSHTELIQMITKRFPENDPRREQLLKGIEQAVPRPHSRQHRP